MGRRRLVPNAGGSPVIHDTPIWLDCDMGAEHQTGDHLIVIGEVTKMSPVEWRRHEPLPFFRGAYRFLRDSIG